MADDPQDVDRILERVGAGELGTAALMASVYAELRAMADRMMGSERGQHTLQPTALVHEAFLRLADGAEVGEKSRLQYLGAAALAMRHILVDHARKRGAQKRGGTWKRITLQGLTEANTPTDEIDLLQLNEALETLESLDPRQAKIVELRFFSGMTGQEIADHLGVSRDTVVRELTLSRAWLQRELSRGD